MTHSGDSVEERLRRLEDTEQIRQLNLEYRRHLDARDLDAYGRLFAADGEWLGGTGYGKGPAGITAMLKERLVGNPAPPGPTSWHLVTEPEIQLEGDRATGLLSWTWLGRGDGNTPVMRLLGRYEDSYVRERGQWRYQRRISHTDIPHGELEMPPGWSSAPSASGAGGGATAAPDAAAGSVEARLRRLEDLAQIRRLFVDYKIVLDKQDFGAYAALFAEDGEFIAGTQRVKGRAAIQALVDGMRGSLLGSAPGDDFHVVVNPLIDLDAADPDRARAEVTWLYVVKGEDGGPALAKLGHYEDVLVRQACRWLFGRREAPTDIG